MTDKPAQRQLAPVDPPMVPFVVGGMAIWAALGLVLLGLDVQQGWQKICLAGVLVALPGLGLMIVHDRNRARRRAATSRRS